MYQLHFSVISPDLTNSFSHALLYVSSFMWWPNMDQEIEQMVKSCTECQVHCSAPPVAPLHPWKWPTHPWSRLHLDFAGPFLNNMFLILVDSHSKWLEVFQMSSTTSIAVIQHLCTVFAQFGLPATVVTDNGSNFTSLEFNSLPTIRNSLRKPKTLY